MSESKIVYWGTVMAESADVPGCWLKAKIRPRWYWLAKRLWLFGRIVWRRWDPQCTPMDWRTAWTISRIAVGFVGPMRVNCGLSGKDGAA